jgi:ketosteroid isomerase-like protein
MPRSVLPIRASSVVVFTLLTCIVTGFTALPAPAVGPHSQKKRDAKREVEILEEQWRMAQLAGDAGTMDKMLSDDYIGISMSGQVNTKAQQLDRVRSHKVSLGKIEMSDVKVKLIGAIAIVTAQADVEGTNENGPVKGTYRYTRVYKRLPNGDWKITSFEATRIPGPRQSRDQQGPKEPAPPPPSSSLVSGAAAQ